LRCSVSQIELARSRALIFVIIRYFAVRRRSRPRSCFCCTIKVDGLKRCGSPCVRSERGLLMDPQEGDTNDRLASLGNPTHGLGACFRRGVGAAGSQVLKEASTGEFGGTGEPME